MKSQNFILSPAIYGIGGAVLLAEFFLFLPDSLKRPIADASLTNVAMLAVDLGVIVILALLLTTVVTIRDGVLQLRICGLPLFRTPIAEITSYTTAFPFLTFQSDSKSKLKFCPVVVRQASFLEVLREINPNIREETPLPKKRL